MTNGVKELDMPKEFKSVAEQLKAMYNALKKWPFMMGITILMFVLLISSEYLTEYSCAMKSHFRKFGNQMSGSGNHLCNYASLLA